MRQVGDEAHEYLNQRMAGARLTVPRLSCLGMEGKPRKHTRFTSSELLSRRMCGGHPAARGTAPLRHCTRHYSSLSPRDFLSMAPPPPSPLLSHFSFSSSHFSADVFDVVLHFSGKLLNSLPLGVLVIFYVIFSQAGFFT